MQVGQVTTITHNAATATATYYWNAGQATENVRWSVAVGSVGCPYPLVMTGGCLSPGPSDNLRRIAIPAEQVTQPWNLKESHWAPIRLLQVPRLSHLHWAETGDLETDHLWSDWYVGSRGKIFPHDISNTLYEWLKVYSLILDLGGDRRLLENPHGLFGARGLTQQQQQTDGP